MDYCLDACSLINLYCGWGGLNEFGQFGNSWAISDKALAECIYVRAFSADGAIVRVPIVASALLAQYPIVVHSLTAQETETFVQLAVKIDDGEAASLSVAHHRNLIFVTDDVPAAIAAAGIGAPVVGSLDLIQTWAGSDPARIGRFPTIVHNIATLAKWEPRPNHPHYGWWTRHATPS